LFGAADKSSDLDLLLISYQSLMSREKFSYDFVDYIRTLPQASNVQPILQAKIPLIKLDFMGV